MDGAQDLDSRFEAVYARREDIAHVFYTKLFEVLPEVQPYLFPDFEKQKRMFAMMVTMLALSLSRKKGFDEYALQLKQAHRQFDVSDNQFLVGGAVLKAAIEEVVGTSISLRDRIALNRATDRMVEAMSRRRVA